MAKEKECSEIFVLLLAIGFYSIEFSRQNFLNAQPDDSVFATKRSTCLIHVGHLAGL